MEHHQLSDVASVEKMPGFHGKMIHTGALTLAYWHIEPNSGLPAHSHFHEQTVNILEGEFELTVEGHTRLLKKGDVVVIPPNIPHSGRTLGQPCQILDVFSPQRDDYR